MINSKSIHPSLERSLLIDTLKALSAQVIVIHHLVSYGPMASSVGLAAPNLVAWFATYGRWAVQVFLVIAGFLTAKSLGIYPATLLCSCRQILKRYIRLVWPFGVAVTLAVLSAELARCWTNDPILPSPASWAQYASHWLLIHTITGHESLSTGVWYVAIDFQLFAVTIVLVWFSRSIRWLGGAPFFVGLLTIISLIWIRNWQAWDGWCLYFYYSYGIGVLVGWLQSQNNHSIQWLRCALMAVFIVLFWQFALTLYGRLAVVLCSSILLILSREYPRRWKSSLTVSKSHFSVLIHYLGARSYALFLIHFSISMLVNASQDRFNWKTPTDGVLAMCTTWIFSMIIADVFHRIIEKQGLNFRGIRNL
jgi:peptidoglycan/LPS O-acetylase OafA/YrhL